MAKPSHCRSPQHLSGGFTVAEHLSCFRKGLLLRLYRFVGNHIQPKQVKHGTLLHVFILQSAGFCAVEAAWHLYSLRTNKQTNQH